MIKTVMIDGGIGRVVCSIPAVETFSSINNYGINVVTSWLEPYLNNKKIRRVYHISHQYLWDDVIKKSELIHPEPYWDHDYYNQKLHLIQAFYKCLGLEVPKDLPKPNIYLQDMEVNLCKKFLKDVKKELGKEKFVVFQPFGAGARYEDGKLIDLSNRSLNIKTAEAILKELSDKYNVLLMSHLDIPELLKYKVMKKKANTREWIIMISQADYVVGIDSFAQHVAYAFDKPGFFIYGGTYPENLAYPIHKIYKKKGYPKEYNPIRLPANNMQVIPVYNEGAMDFTDEEINEIVDNIIKDIGE